MWREAEAPSITENSLDQLFYTEIKLIMSLVWMLTVTVLIVNFDVQVTSRFIPNRPVERNLTTLETQQHDSRRKIAIALSSLASGRYVRSCYSLLIIQLTIFVLVGW